MSITSNPVLRACLTAIMLSIQTLGTGAATPDELRSSFMLRLDEASARRDEQLKVLTTGYLAALERQREAVKASGDLNAVIPIHEEISRVKSGQDPLPRLPEDTPATLKQMRGKFDEHRGKVLFSHAEALTGWFAKLEEALKAQQSELTKAGKIDDAIAAKQTLETLAAAVRIEEARELLKQGGAAGRARPALRLRRFGDNLEVIVFPDRGGKLSMDSPVENVREETGDKKERGDTKAKVLGEFVGAKGYAVDPFVSFHQIFNTKNPGLMRANQVALNHSFVIDGGKGVKVSYDKAAKTPYCHFADVIPPITHKGTYRFTTKYYIPQSNRHISGFQLMQGEGGGAPVGGVLFKERKKWTSASATSESVNASPNIVLWLSLPAAIDIADAMDDFVVLAEVKIEHLKFTAFLQKKFGANGEAAESINDARQQPVFIVNGQFKE